MGLFREKAENFVQFHHHEARIVSLELALAKQQELNKALLAYIEADVAVSWLVAGKGLVTAIRDALE